MNTIYPSMCCHYLLLTLTLFRIFGIFFITQFNKWNHHSTTIDNIRVAILEKWNTITLDEIKQMMDNLPQQVQAVWLERAGTQSGRRFQCSVCIFDYVL